MQSPGSTDIVKEQYLLVVDGKPAGPFNIEELRERGLKPGDFVKTDTMDDYKEAHEVPALRELFGFARRALPLQYFGSFDQRAIASVIDWLIVSFGFVFVAIGAVIIIPDQTIRVIVSVAMVAMIPIAKLIYHINMETSEKQGTYGKQLMNIRVTDIYGQRIDVAKAFARNLAKLLSILTLCAGYLMCFFNKKQQCLHDVIAETLVIKDRL